MTMLNDYFFWVVALGTMILGATAAVVGTTVVLEKQSQLGDAIGHSVFPGIVFSFILFQTRHPLVLTAGAFVAGLVAFQLIHWIHRHSDFSYESILALILSSMFGLGMVLYSYIQGNPNFQRAAQAGLNRYIMGQAAYLMIDDVILISVTSLCILFTFIVFFPKIKLVLFDKVFAKSIGISTERVSKGLLLLCLLVICIGIKTVGIILISSMLVVPTVAASQWTKHYRSLVILSGFIGTVCALIGTYFSTVVSDLATGPMIVIAQTLCALLSILFAPSGVLWQFLRRKDVSV